MTSSSEAHRADMERGADRLLLAGKRVRRAAGPGCGCCKDLDEALTRHAVEELRARIKAVTSKATLTLDGEARRCARIKDPLKRAQTIADLIKDSKVQRGMVGGFRAEVARYTGDADREDEPEAVGSALTFDEVLPWHEPVEGDELLDEMTAAVRRHAHCTDEDAVLGCLWVVHSERRHLGNVGTLPRLIITAGREDSGKTHFALALLSMMEAAEHTISPRPANIYRAIEAHGCAFVLDEVDDWYPKDLGMREIINSGFNRSGASVLRCEDTGQDGKNKLESRRHSTFTPIALVGINLLRVLARPVVSRGLIVHMRPARVGDEVEDLFDNPPAVNKLRVLARKVKRFVADHDVAIGAASPERPDGVINRLWSTWRPLLSIADVAGGDWPKQARMALEVARARAADPGLGIQLLADAYDIISKAPAGPAGPRMRTGDLISGLLQLEERTWAIYGKARQPIRDIDVARLLEPYEVRPTQIKTGGKNRRGYMLGDIEAAIDRYAPSLFSDARVRTRYPRYPATSGEKPSDINDIEGSWLVAGHAQPATDGTEKVAGSGSGVSARYPLYANENNELQAGSGVAAAGGGSEKNKRTGNGLDTILHRSAAAASGAMQCSTALPQSRPTAAGHTAPPVTRRRHQHRSRPRSRNASAVGSKAPTLHPMWKGCPRDRPDHRSGHAPRKEGPNCDVAGQGNGLRHPFPDLRRDAQDRWRHRAPSGRSGVPAPLHAGHPAAAGAAGSHRGPARAA
jgi:hypothetical protein